MDVTVPLWAIQTGLTVLLWTVVSLWPIEKGGGDYNFGPALDALYHGIVGVIGTLLIWLVYFAVT
jgi:hypothetical protein